MMFLGHTVNDLLVGGTSVSEAYVGNNKIFPVSASDILYATNFANFDNETHTDYPIVGEPNVFRARYTYGTILNVTAEEYESQFTGISKRGRFLRNGRNDYQFQSGKLADLIEYPVISVEYLCSGGQKWANWAGVYGYSTYRYGCYIGGAYINGWGGRDNNGYSAYTSIPGAYTTWSADGFSGGSTGFGGYRVAGMLDELHHALVINRTEGWAKQYCNGNLLDRWLINVNIPDFYLLFFAYGFDLLVSNVIVWDGDKSIDDGAHYPLPTKPI